MKEKETKQRKQTHQYLIGVIEEKTYLFPPEEEIIKKYLVRKAYSRNQAIFFLKRHLKRKSIKITFVRDLGPYTEEDERRDRRIKKLFRVVKQGTEKRKIEVDLYGGCTIYTVNQFNSPIKITFRLNKFNKPYIQEIIFLGRDRLEDTTAEQRLTREEYLNCVSIAEMLLKTYV
jgi:hypothetical protein